MNCYNHPDRPAVIQCRNCGKGFCREEADQFVDGLCPECLKKADIKVKEERKAEIKKEKTWYVRNLVVYALFFAIGAAFGLYLASASGNTPETVDGAGTVPATPTTMALMFGYVLSLLAISWRYAGLILEKILTSGMREGSGCLVSWIVWIPLKFIAAALVASVSCITVIPFILIHSLYKTIKKE